LGWECFSQNCKNFKEIINLSFPDKNNINKIIKILKVNFGQDIKPRRNNILDVLIATKLSQNTNDKLSYKAYKNLKNKYPEYSDLARANAKDIKNQIGVCGLGNKKSEEIKSLLNKIFSDYNTYDLSFIKKWSSEKIYDTFLRYKGIGIKTISCVLAFALNRPVFPVDTHIHRILNRLELVSTKNPDDTFYKIQNLIPDNEKILFHKNLILFGRTICKSAKPICNICPVVKLCNYADKIFTSVKSKKSLNDFIILNEI
jgi:endonuclease III